MDSDGARDAMNGKSVEQKGKRNIPSILFPLGRNDLGRAVSTSKKVGQKFFINTINHLHFIDGQVFIHMVFPMTSEEFLLRVYPEPCRGTQVKCSISERININLENFVIKHLIVDDGRSVYSIPVRPEEVTRNSLKVTLEGNGYALSNRMGKRFLCKLIEAEIQQDNTIVYGNLEDFNPYGLRIVIPGESGILPSMFNSKETLFIKLHRESQIIFSGKCRYIRGQDSNGIVILQPLNMQQRRFKERKNRNPRVSLIPNPKVVFEHPLNQKIVTYDVFDITTSGFSLKEDTDSASLMPGMIIPRITILYAGSLKIECSAQVIYSAPARFSKQVKHGLSILDMEMKAYSQLFDIVSKVYDPHANMSPEINMDDLWEFFFHSGFIYPKKYEHLSEMKEKFKGTYQSLYHEGQHIFTNFTYQQNGKIFGHNCTIRSYQRAWMIHHLAARSSGARRIGLDLLKHSHYYFDGMFRLPAIGMDYMIMYFRPNNRFPDYFFGGVCREFKNPKACSMDLFAYLTCHIPPEPLMLPERWSVQECSSGDLQEFREMYGRISGGLMIDAFGIDREPLPGEDPLDQMYARIGLKRKCSVYVLRHRDKNKAFFVVDQSDAGINLSELLNSIKVVVTDGEDLTWDMMQRAVGSFREFYDSGNIPLLVLPLQYMLDAGIPYEKEYYLWALNTQFGDDYVEHIKQKLQFRVLKFLMKFIMVKIFKH